MNTTSHTPQSYRYIFIRIFPSLTTCNLQVQLAKVLRLLRLVKLMKTINFAHLTNIAEDRFAIPAVGRQSLQYLLFIPYLHHTGTTSHRIYYVVLYAFDWLSAFIAVFNLLDMFFRVVFISHLVGCLWWGLTYGEMDGPHWFNNQLNTPEQLEWASFQDQYVVSLYWTIQTLTTTGYGDFVPTNDNERILCLVILVLGATVFSYVVAHISELVQSFNHSEGILLATILLLCFSLSSMSLSHF